MERRSLTPISVPVFLYFLTAITLIMASVRVVQIPLSATPPDVAHLMTRPLPYWLHAVSGVAFGVIGPLQFGRALAGRFGRLHRLLGRVFVVAGIILGLSGLRLLIAFPGGSTAVLDLIRGIGGLALLAALWLAISAIRRRDVPHHRAWMIRAYAIGVGQSLVAFVLFPVYLATNEPPIGLLADLCVAVSWIIAIIMGEWAIRRIARAETRPAQQVRPAGS